MVYLRVNNSQQFNVHNALSRLARKFLIWREEFAENISTTSTVLRAFRSGLFVSQSPKPLIQAIKAIEPSGTVPSNDLWLTEYFICIRRSTISSYISYFIHLFISSPMAVFSLSLILDDDVSGTRDRLYHYSRKHFHNMAFSSFSIIYRRAF